MRIAVLADAHGNLPALEAALDAAKRHHPDLLVIAGDSVNGAPDSRACWLLAKAQAHVLLRGNHERYAIDPESALAEPDASLPRFKPAVWTAQQLLGLEADVRAAPIQAVVHPEVRVMHATPTADRVNILAWTPDEEVEAHMGDTPERVLVRAHNHVPYTRTLPDGRLLVSVGAVGLALAGRPEAQWLLITREANGWRVQHQSTPYDVPAALARFDADGYLEATGPMGWLYRREVETGAHQVGPFTRFERRFYAQNPHLLAEADAALEAAWLAFLQR